MPISITCSECQKKLKVADTAAGKKVRCPACKAVIAVPAAADFVEPDEDEAITEAPPKKKPAAEPPARNRRDDDDEDEDDEGRRPKSRKRLDEDEDEDQDEEERRPKSRRRRDDEEDEEERRPASRKRRNDDDDEDEEDRRPNSRRRRDDDDDEEVEERRPKKKKQKRRSSGGQPHRGMTILLFGILSLICCIPLGAWLLGYRAITMANEDIDEMDRGRMDDSGRTTTQIGKVCGIVGCVFGVVWLITGIALKVMDR